MSVSKRLRFEVLRRDDHTCRYCGDRAPYVRLTVDHVVPTALGGTDDPTNLVAACADCNAGKSSMPANADLVADVAADALRWAAAIKVAADVVERDVQGNFNKLHTFAHDIWGYPSTPLPLGWEQTVLRFHSLGLTERMLAYAALTAFGNPKVLIENQFRYMCGVAWQMVGNIQSAAHDAIERADLGTD